MNIKHGNLCIEIIERRMCAVRPLAGIFYKLTCGILDLYFYNRIQILNINLAVFKIGNLKNLSTMLIRIFSTNDTAINKIIIAMNFALYSPAVPEQSEVFALIQSASGT